MQTLEEWADYWENSCTGKKYIIAKFDDAIGELTKVREQFIAGSYSVYPDINSISNLSEILANHYSSLNAINLIRAACNDERTVRDANVKRLLSTTTNKE